jgi:hypothetical protein
VKSYTLGDIASTLILVAAVMVALVFTANVLPAGPLRLAIWIVLFVAAAALGSASWLAPPAALVMFWLAVALAPSAQGGCPAGQFCEPVSEESPFLSGALIVFFASVLGAALRMGFDAVQRQRKAKKHDTVAPWETKDEPPAPNPSDQNQPKP